ncbi:hypothetical protein ACL2XO_20470 [Sodalis sp. RH15]|uniref:E492 group microcin n=1 Tax=Sodalis sp. RH15 TaxID=3394330 RepID=UPI0039B59972
MNNGNIPPSDQKIMNNLGRDIAFGALGGALTGGPPGAVMGAGLAAAQNVTIGLMDHGPVNVQMPQVPMRPTQLHQVPSLNIPGGMPSEQ